MEKPNKPANMRWALLAGLSVVFAIMALGAFGSVPPKLKMLAASAGILFLAATIAWLMGASVIQSMLVKARGAAPSRVAVGIAGSLCWIVGFWLLVMMAPSLPHPPPQNPQTVASSSIPSPKTDANEDAAVAPPSAPSTATINWHYETSKDEMRGTTTRYAYVESDNELQFAFPYAGGSRGTLGVREMAGATDIILMVDKGQFLCNGFRSETVAMKFDGGSIEKYSCISPSDGTSNAILIRPAQRFLSHLRRSHAAIVEMQFFQEGSQQLSFDTDGLHW